MEARTPAHLPEVTDRQVEVAKLIAHLDNPAIAERLGISLAGAKYHVSELLARLNLTSREEIGDWYRGRSSSGLLRRFALAPLGWALAGAGGVAAGGVAAVAIVLGQGGGGVEVAPVVVPTQQPAVGNGAFVATGAPAIAWRTGYTATLLEDGRVLLAGGQTDEAETTAELYDPATGEFESTGATVLPRSSNPAVRLADGRVLLIGGLQREGITNLRGRVLASTESFDPATGSFTEAAPMNEPRSRHAAVTLRDGRVLVSGGITEIEADGSPIGSVASAEIYDPAADRFVTTGAMNVARRSHQLTLLADGRVLVSGGGPLEVYDPGSGIFSLLDGEPVFGDQANVATLLVDGRVLITGVQHDDDIRQPNQPPRANRVFLVDPTSGAITRVGDMRTERSNEHKATLLADGRVLITGGGGYGGDLFEATVYPPNELFDPSSEAFESMPSIESALLPDSGRASNVVTHLPGHTATRLIDGSVLIIGQLPAPIEMGAERFVPTAAPSGDRYAVVIAVMKARPTLVPGALLDAESVPTFGGGETPIALGIFVQAANAMGLQIRELPTGMGMCADSAGARGGQALRAEHADESAAEDFLLYVYSSPESLAQHWILDEEGEADTRPGSDCAKSLFDGRLMRMGASGYINGNQLMLFDVPPGSLHGFDEHDPEVRAMLIEAFESMEP